MSRAKLLATAQKESGAWLNNALPVSSHGTLLDSESFSVAIALRVGAGCLYLLLDVCLADQLQKAGLPLVLELSAWVR